MTESWCRIGRACIAAGASMLAVGLLAGPVGATAENGGSMLTLAIAASVGRPYLLDVAEVTGLATGAQYTLQTRRAGTTRWSAAPDIMGVWGDSSGRLFVRAVSSSDAGQVTSNVAEVTVGNGKVPSWLAELNAYRAVNDAAPVAEYTWLSHADALHVRYMIKTGDFTHTENPHSKWYTKVGAEAGESSDLALGITDPINAWARAPYHALSELNKYGTLAGFAQGGGFAALWVDQNTSVRQVSPPYYQFPAAGKTTSLRTFYGDEIPDPVSHCKKPHAGGYGLPIIYGGQATVSQPSAKIRANRTALPVCVVNAGIYGNAVFVIPLRPLPKHKTITVRVYYHRRLQSRWRFRTR